MIITGIITFIIGVALINFLQPKADVRYIQLQFMPKVVALGITLVGILVFVIGVIKALLV
jgi:flagellar biosynthesis protein FliQ